MTTRDKQTGLPLIGVREYPSPVHIPLLERASQVRALVMHMRIAELRKSAGVEGGETIAFRRWSPPKVA